MTQLFQHLILIMIYTVVQDPVISASDLNHLILIIYTVVHDPVISASDLNHDFYSCARPSYFSI